MKIYFINSRQCIFKYTFANLYISKIITVWRAKTRSERSMRKSEINSLLKDNNLGQGESGKERTEFRVAAISRFSCTRYRVCGRWLKWPQCSAAMFALRQNRFWPFHKIGIIWINCRGRSGHKSNFQVAPWIYIQIESNNR